MNSVIMTIIPVYMCTSSERLKSIKIKKVVKLSRKWKNWEGYLIKKEKSGNNSIRSL